MKNIKLLFLFLFLSGFTFAQTGYRLLVGTYTNTPAKSEGIYSYDFNDSTGNCRLLSITKNVINPSYLGLSPDGKFVYAVNESGDASTVSTFKYDDHSGELQFLNKVASAGADPCYITVDNKNVIVANYSSGSLAVFKRKEDGFLSPAYQIIKYHAKSIDPKGRQESSHAHMATFSPDHRFLLVVDLGGDLIYIYKYRPGKEKPLKLKRVVKTNAGSGPRHITFSPGSKYAYLVHEFEGLLSAFSYHSGKLNKIQEVETKPVNFAGKVDGAEILVSADGHFLYESNRGDLNTISIFKISNNGTLQLVETVSSLGKGPRSFTIDPTGKFLLVAHQYSNDVVIFNRDATTGRLTDSGKRVQVGAPVCLIFAAKEG
ncbi:MAG: lactonase family protein [Ginsengibacter sp.]